MGIVVKKFGGTSVSDLSLIQRAASLVKRTMENGDLPVVVVSAMAGVTNQLVAWAQTESGQTPEELAEHDVVISSGEQVTAGLLAIALRRTGLTARSWMGWQVPIRTTADHTSAEILSINEEALRNNLAQGIIPVIAGFQGIDPSGRVTTLGRGGSDTTAVALAATLKADLCEIFTDVDGVYTADPRVVRCARCFDQISYDDMLALARHGTKVLHPRSVQWARDNSIPVRVLSTFATQPRGTLVTWLDQHIHCGIAQRRAILWTLTGVTERGQERLGKALLEAHIDPLQWEAKRDENRLSFLTWDEYRSLVGEMIEEIMMPRVGCCDAREITLIALIGDESVPIVLRTAQGCIQNLGAQGIAVRGFFQSLRVTGILVDHKCASRALCYLHNFLGLNEERTPPEEICSIVHPSEL